MLNAILQQIGQTNPALLQMISQNQDAFFRMLTEPGGGGGAAPAGSTTGGRTAAETPRSGGGDAQQEGEGGDYFAPGVIHVTPQDKEAIERVIICSTSLSTFSILNVALFF